MDLHDCHAHLADERLATAAEGMAAAFRAAGGRAVVATAARRAEWERVRELTALPGVIGALGVHPWFLADWRGDETVAELAQALATTPAFRAVGEIGLDFWQGRDDAALQTEAFAAQLGVAVARGLPAVFHNRRSWPEFFGAVDAFGGRVAGVCHNFTGGRELARDALDRGLYLSFAGPLTYPGARRAPEAARYAPADRILTETDAPDLPPHPRRADSSAPADVGRVLAVLAELRRTPVAAMAEQVGANFRRLFGGVG